MEDRFWRNSYWQRFRVCGQKRSKSLTGLSEQGRRIPMGAVVPAEPMSLSPSLPRKPHWEQKVKLGLGEHLEAAILLKRSSLTLQDAFCCSPFLRKPAISQPTLPFGWRPLYPHLLQGFWPRMAGIPPVRVERSRGEKRLSRPRHSENSHPRMLDNHGAGMNISLCQEGFQPTRRLMYLGSSSVLASVLSAKRKDPGWTNVHPSIA